MKLNKSFKKYLDEVHRWRENIYNKEKKISSKEIGKKYQRYGAKSAV